MTAPAAAAAAGAPGGSSKGSGDSSSSKGTAAPSAAAQKRKSAVPVFELKGRFERAPIQELVGHRKRVGGWVGRRRILCVYMCVCGVPNKC